MSSIGPLPRLSLISVLITLISVGSVLVLGSLGVYSYNQEYDRITREMQARGSESLARLSKTLPPFIDAYAINEYDKLVTHEIVLMQHLAVIERDFRMGAITGNSAYVSGRIFMPDGTLQEFDASDPRQQLVLDGAYQKVSANMGDAGALGEVVVYLPAEIIKRKQHAALIETTLSSLLAMSVLIALLVLAAQRLFITPLDKAVNSLAKQDEDGIPLDYVADQDYRELALLSHGVNSMIATIRQSRDVLRSERARLQYVIEGTNVGTWEWNVQSGEVVINERWAEIIGYRPGELQPISIDTWQRLAHADDLEQPGALLRRHFAGEIPYYQCEARMRHKDGHWVWVLDRGKVVQWSQDGQPLLMAGTHQDITERKEQALELANSEARFRSFFESNSSVMLLIEPVSGEIVDANQSADAYYGYGAGKLKGRLISDLNTMPPDKIAAARHRAATNEQNYFHFQHRLANGENREVEVYSTPIASSDGSPLLFSIVHDITDRVLAEQQLQLAARVFTYAREGIIITDDKGNIVDVNEAFSLITGYAHDEVIGRNPRLLSSGKHGPDFYATMWRSLKHSGHWYGEIWNRRKNGELFAELLTISTVLDANDSTRHFVGLFSDITTIKENERELKHIAHYDPLTGLANRLLLADRLRQAMLQEHRRGKQVAVAFLDLDGFKAVNDNHGHSTGDHLLVDLSKRMQAVLRDTDTLARLGGDEFVVVLSDLAERAQCEPLLARLLDAISRPARIDGAVVSVSGSIGVTFYPQNEDIDADQLMRQADQAMYQAKLAGKNRVHVFDAEQDRDQRGRLEQTDRIQAALAKNELELFYQPKVDMQSGRLAGLEALIRWRHPDKGLLTPDKFLPSIENHPLICELGEWTLRSALRQISAWRQQGLPTRVSVNIAALHLQRSDFADRLRQILDEFNDVPTDQLELEILETSALENISHVSRLIRECQQMGVSFSLDDFGTGYSSLTYLKRLPVEVLKIDRSFVRDMHEDPDDLTILEGVVSMARAFQRQVVAEGVESEEHGEFLLWMGCRLAQGYAIAHPMPGKEVMPWQASWIPPSRWKSAASVGADKLPLLVAIVQHRAWINALESHLAGETNAPPPLNPRQCHLGRWLDSDDPKLDEAQMGDLIALHEQVHAIASKLMAADEMPTAELAWQLEQLDQSKGHLLDFLRGLIET